MSDLLLDQGLWALEGFLVGILVGWLLWRFGRRPVRTAEWNHLQSHIATADARVLRLMGERDEAAAERDQLRARLDRTGNGSVRVELGERPRHDREVVVDLTEGALALAERWKRDPPPPHQWDDLKLISGIGPVLETTLHREGIYTYTQLAHLEEHEVDELQLRLDEFPDRIRRDQWVEQAAELARQRA